MSVTAYLPDSIPPDIIMIAVSSGLAMALTLWVIFSVISEMPVEDRAWMDRPPLLYRLVWPFVRILELYAGRLLYHRDTARLQQLLRQAGLEYTLTSRQFRAGQYVAVIVAAGAAVPAGAALPEIQRAAITSLCCIAGVLLPVLWLRDSAMQRQAEIIRSLPYCLDIITLSVESGTHLTGGLTHAYNRLPASPLRDELGRVLRDVRAGRTRAEAMKEFASRTGSARVKQLVGSLIQAERSGSSIGPLLRTQAEQLRGERFQRAEKQALEAPVRMLVPLILFIFPTTFLVLGFLMLSKAIQEQLVTSPVLLWAYHWPHVT